MCNCEELSQNTDLAASKNLCQYWDDMEICAKYEKVFNFNVKSAVLMKSNQLENEETLSVSQIPTMKCFSNDFKLNLFQKDKKVKNRYTPLSPIKTKKNLYIYGKFQL